MPLGTKGNSLIVKDGKLAENCGCCGQWYCCESQCQQPPFNTVRATLAGENRVITGTTRNLSVNYSYTLTIEADSLNGLQSAILFSIDTNTYFYNQGLQGMTVRLDWSGQINGQLAITIFVPIRWQTSTGVNVRYNTSVLFNDSFGFCGMTLDSGNVSRTAFVPVVYPTLGRGDQAQDGSPYTSLLTDAGAGTITISSVELLQ